MHKLTILGCGSSWGVPVIGCKCAICLSDSSYNKRLRSAITIDNEQNKILVDCGFDIRSQLLKYDIDRINAIILTHDHADHVCGLDELRVFHDLHGITPKFYSDHKTLDIVMKRYKYLFDRGVFHPIGIDFNSRHKIGDIEIQFFRQDHGVMDSLGMRIGDTVYTNDVMRYPEESKQYLYNANTWIVDCVDYKSTPTHAGLKCVIAWMEEFKPKKMYLTNMSHEIDYFHIESILPPGIKPAYDGLILEINPAQKA